MMSTLLSAICNLETKPFSLLLQALNQTSKKHQRRPTPLIVDHDVLNKHAKQWMPCSPIFLEVGHMCALKIHAPRLI